MKRYLLLVLLTGCSTVIPVQKKFPEAPVLLAKASNLDTLAQGSKMSDLLRNSTANYTAYYTLKARFDAWVDWYTAQSQLK